MLELTNILWERYQQGIETDPGGNAPIWDDLHAYTSLQKALQHISDTYTLADENSEDHDFTRKEDP